MPEVKDYVVLKTRVEIGETIWLKIKREIGRKVWWIHPDSLEEEVELNQDQVKRIKRHGSGPFILNGVEEREDGVWISFENDHGEMVEEKAEYFTI